MNQSSINKFRQSRAKELLSLGRILLQENIIRDDGPFQIAASECRSSRDSYWSYNIEGLKLGEANVSEIRMKHTRPSEVKKYIVELTVRLTGLYTDENSLTDPFQDLNVNIEVLATADSQADEYTYKEWPISCAWHLDKQISGDDDEISHFVHPVYHFQYGGQRIWNKQSYDYGTHLLLESPRIAHPPLDGILAVDFVLSNYYGDKWNTLRGESEARDRYNELMLDVQHRVWRPYSFATASRWYQPPGLTFTSPHPWASQLIWPQLG